MLEQQLIDLLPLLGVQQRIFLVLEVGMSVDPQKIYRSRHIGLLPQYSQLQVAAARRYLNPDRIGKVEHFCDGTEGVIVLGDKQFEQPHVFAPFGVQVQLSDEGERLETQQQIDGRHCEFGGLPAEQAAGGSVEGQASSFCEVGGCGEFVEDLAHLLQDGSSVGPDLLIYMEVGDLIETRPQLLIGYIQNHQLSYGDKFERFSQQVFKSFERVAAIRFYQNQYAKQRLPLAIFAAILFSKNHRFLNDDFSGMQFLDDFKSKTKAVTAANPNIKIDKIWDLMRAKISASHFRHVFEVPKMSNEVHELMNLIAEYKGKGEVEHYNEEQVKRIGSAFGENLIFINYDEDKSALNQTALSHRNVYVLKAKEMYFVLFKEQEIELIEKGTVTHEELAVIFNIQSKLEKSPQKPNPNPSNDPIPAVMSPTKQTNDLKKSSKGANQHSASQVQVKKNELTQTKIKHSVLFPDQVSCTYCCKKVSQFSAIFWSYNHYCFQCVLSPKKDISFIPTSLIQKFLKGQKIQSKEYLLICPECKSDTVIPNYRPWDKPKNYRCKACQKEICVEHEKMVGECFCKCLECEKPTITIPTIFIKYCLSCKVRLCELCSVKSRKDCDCICPNCGQNQKVDHETCKPRCHSCFARDIALMPCQCGKKLCPACYFNSLDPKAAICVLK